MNYKTFLKQIIEAVNALLPDNIRVYLSEITKNNGLTRKVILQKKEEMMGVSPVVYPEAYFAAYENGMPIGRIAKLIAGIFVKPLPTAFDTRHVMDFEAVKNRIIFRLVSREKNRKMLDTYVNRDYLDLSLTYGIYISDGKSDSGISAVRRELAEIWGIDETVLYQLAMENTPKLLGEKLENMEAPDMYMLSNLENFYGASVLCYARSLKMLASKLESPLYILPSSVHELILVPEKAFTDSFVFLKGLMKEISTRENMNETFLSDSLYYYDPMTDRVTAASFREAEG